VGDSLRDALRAGAVAARLREAAMAEGFRERSGALERGPGRGAARGDHPGTDPAAPPRLGAPGAEER